MKAADNILLSPEHRCAYLPGRQARMAFFEPTASMHPTHYDQLAQLGFRRSGNHVYRPECQHCQACIPIRVPVNDFRPNRSQRRAWKHVANLSVVERLPEFDPEHFDLYRRYQTAQHPESGMATSNQMEYMAFMTCGWSRTRFLEFRRNNELLAVAVTDHLTHALSAVYTFYEPTATNMSLGTLSVLQQIELARAWGLKWLYLGYWIRDCQKMSYKINFRPLELFQNSRWTGLQPGETVPMGDFSPAAG